MSVVIVSAGLSNPSSTTLLAERIRARLDGVETELVELRPLAHAITDAMLSGFASGELASVIDRVRRADALVVVTPVFSASYSGLFKSFVDVLEPGILEGTPVLLAATAGTARHSLVLEHALRPLFTYQRAVPVPTAVFAATDDFASADLDARIARAAGELLTAIGHAPQARRRAGGPEFDENSEGFVDFAQLLGE